MDEKTKMKRLTKRQKDFLRVFPKKLCNISKTCESQKLSRQTFYTWMDKCDIFKKEVENIVESQKDDLETALYKQALVDENTTVLIFLAKTKMKERGYVEQIETKEIDNPWIELAKRSFDEGRE